MNKRFIYELIVGILGIATTMVYGPRGLAVFALLAFLPLFRRKRPDEREIQLFYKTGNLTAALTLLAAVAVFMLSDKMVNGYRIGDNWLYYVVYSFLVAYGVSGIIIFKRG